MIWGLQFRLCAQPDPHTRLPCQWPRRKSSVLRISTRQAPSGCGCARCRCVCAVAWWCCTNGPWQTQALTNLSCLLTHTPPCVVCNGCSAGTATAGAAARAVEGSRGGQPPQLLVVRRPHTPQHSPRVPELPLPWCAAPLPQQVLCLGVRGACEQVPRDGRRCRVCQGVQRGSCFCVCVCVCVCVRVCAQQTQPTPAGAMMHESAHAACRQQLPCCCA
jgi:hypothetical protein